jgi:LTXXQ motif family protein
MTRQTSAVLGLSFLFCLAAPALAVAQPQPDPGVSDRTAGQPGGEDRRKIVFEADLAGMRTALNLRPDQTAPWSAFESAARAGVAAFANPKLGPDAGSDPDNGLGARAERMLRMSEALRSRGEALKAVDTQWKALLAALDEGQRRTANILGERMLRELGAGRHAGMGPHPMPWRGGEQRGPGPGPGQRM